MATTIHALGDTIKIDRAFVSGKDRIAVNGEVVFEGKMRARTPQEFNAGNRHYTVETRTVSSMTGAIAIHLQIHENGQVVHSGLYDQQGNPVRDEAQAKSAGAIQTCALIGGILGFAAMMFLNAATGVVPGGAIGGAIGGGGGAGLGYGVGSLLFKRRS